LIANDALGILIVKIPSFQDRVNKASMVEFKETLKMVIKDKVEKDSVGLSTVTLKDEYMM